MREKKTLRRVTAMAAALSITVSMAAPAFAGTYYIDDGDITITKLEDGRQKITQKITQGERTSIDAKDEETIITTKSEAITTLLPEAEDRPVADAAFEVPDADQPDADQPDADQPDADQPDADQPDADQPDADQPDADQPDADQPEQDKKKETEPEEEPADEAAPAKELDQSAPAAQQSSGQIALASKGGASGSTSVNPKPNGFWGNVITVVNNVANSVLNVTLRDVKIDVRDKREAALSVRGTGNVALELDGNNELRSGYGHAGLDKRDSESKGVLTINDKDKNGSLYARGGGDDDAGIGGVQNDGGGNITINGGTIVAEGNSWSSAIGGGDGSDGHDIIINGGDVTAKSNGSYGAGIGGGCNGKGYNITINGGTVRATGSMSGAGIGGDSKGEGYNITINRGHVIANGGPVRNNVGSGGAGIGGGSNSNGHDITINGGTVEATGGSWGAGIGGGNEKDGYNITIIGGNVTANGGSNGGSGIGSGGSYLGNTGAAVKGKGYDITITGGNVTAKGGFAGAGIGGGYMGVGSNITVSGDAKVTAIAGGGDNEQGAGATIGNGGRDLGDRNNHQPVDGTEIQAKIDGIITGYIHHIIYNDDGTIKKEWWEPEHNKPVSAPDENQPGAPAGDDAVTEGSTTYYSVTLPLHVEDFFGRKLDCRVERDGDTLTLTADAGIARLHGTLDAVEVLRAQGVKNIVFVTNLCTSNTSVAELLAKGGSDTEFAVEHNGLVSRVLAGGKAAGLACQLR